MGIDVLWRIPVQGDGRAVRDEDLYRGDYNPADGKRHVYARTGVRRDGYTYYDLIAQIARAAELAGFDGLHIPQSAAGEEPLIVAGALAREVQRLRLVAAFPAPFISPVYASKIAVSFQRLTNGRLGWNPVIENDPQPWHGRRRSVEEQVKRTDEFLEIAKGLFDSPPFSFKGDYYEVENGGFSGPLAGQNLPLVYLSGGSEEELVLSAKRADVHVFDLEPVADLQIKIAKLNALAAAEGRTLRYGVRADIIARHSDEAALDFARRQWEQASRKTVPITGPSPVSSGNYEGLLPAPNLWSGFGAYTPNTGLTLVGGYEQLTDRFAEYAEAGVSSFILSAYPHLEEAYRIGELLLPQVRARIAETIRNVA